MLREGKQVVVVVVRIEPTDGICSFLFLCICVSFYSFHFKKMFYSVVTM